MDDSFINLPDPWQEKYERLVEAHEKLQKLNQSLEDKLLKLAEDHHQGTIQFSHQTQNLTQRLVEARLYIHQLEEENDRYRNDVNVVVQLLQCKPSSFIPPKIDSLPEDLQRKVLGQKNMAFCRREKKIIKVQVPTFPPTDIMYKCRSGKQHTENELVSTAIMAKVLKEREREREENLKNRCQCTRITLPTLEKGTQTLPSCTISCIDFSLPDEGTLADVAVQERKCESSAGTSTLSNHDDASAHQSSSSSLSSSSHSPTWSRRPDSLSLNQTRRLAGRCVRVLDERAKEEGAETHWSTTVLVQHPPKSHSREFQTQKSLDKSPDADPFDSPPTHPIPIYSSQQQYYRAQKRSFWTRSSSTTSTETEI